MNELAEIINGRLNLLKHAIKAAERDERTFPEGRLRISKTAGQMRYYEVLEKNDTSGRYLHMHDQLSTIKQLAQKDYNRQFLKLARTEQHRLEKLLAQYQKQYAELSYDELSNERKQFINPYILPDDLYAREWQSRKFKSNPYKPEKKIYDTRRGEKVRSKSEAIIADMLYELGIPYRYEYPVRMLGGQIRYPDFTLLKVKSKEELYLEHFGLLDDAGYRKDALEKIDMYRASGIYLGRNLLFTYEMEDAPLDIKGIRKMLEDLFVNKK